MGVWPTVLPAVLLAAARPAVGSSVLENHFSSLRPERWAATGGEWRARDGTLPGRGDGDGGNQRWVIRGLRFGDFVLQVEMQTPEPGSQGWAVASIVFRRGRVQEWDNLYLFRIRTTGEAEMYCSHKRVWSLVVQSLRRYDCRRWHKVRLEARGADLRAWIDGEIALQKSHTRLKTGSVALMVTSGDTLNGAPADVPSGKREAARREFGVAKSILCSVRSCLSLTRFLIARRDLYAER